MIAESVRMLTYSRLEVVFKDVPEGIYNVICVNLEEAKTQTEGKWRLSTKVHIIYRESKYMKSISPPSFMKLY